jgi:hypothetical protein
MGYPQHCGMQEKEPEAVEVKAVKDPDPRHVNLS